MKPKNERLLHDIPKSSIAHHCVLHIQRSRNVSVCARMQGVSTSANIPVGIKQVSSLTASTTVSVVSTYACLTKISVVAYTGASWLSPPASISPIGAVTAQLLPLQVALHQPPALETVDSSIWVGVFVVKTDASISHVGQAHDHAM